jgi:hypothetical protein
MFTPLLAARSGIVSSILRLRVLAYPIIGNTYRGWTLQTALTKNTLVPGLPDVSHPGKCRHKFISGPNLLVRIADIFE